MLIKHVLLQEQKHLEFYEAIKRNSDRRTSAVVEGLQHQQNQVLKRDVTAVFGVMGE